MIHNFPRKVKDLSSDAASAPAGLESIREPIEEDLSAVDSVIRRRLESHVVLIRTIADYIVGDLQRAGAVSVEGGIVRPTMAA